MGKNTDVDGGGLGEFQGRDPVQLGDAAKAALADVADGTQSVLEETNFTKVKFVGMSFDSLDAGINIGDEMTFLVRARCIGTADEASKRDGAIRHVVKMDVQSVVKHEG